MSTKNRFLVTQVNEKAHSVTLLQYNRVKMLILQGKF